MDKQRCLGDYNYPCNILLILTHQGPALYAYNDAVFEEGDWKGILMLWDSNKEEDMTKVGRFGLGFKSVFHMTGTVLWHPRKVSLLTLNSPIRGVQN